MQSIFSFLDYPVYQFHWAHLANLRLSLYSNLVKSCLFSQKRVGELNSRISSDITQIQDTLTSTIAEFLRHLF
jgi:ABC-type transport system involved in cytochrome bd biosynthesis fused ATPase/permease subunit